MAISAVQISSTNPADPADVVGTFVPGGGIDVDRAVAAAVAAAAGWAGTPGQARADALSRVAARVEARAEELAGLIRREVGKPIVEARGEAARTAAILRYHAQAALDPDGETYPPADGRSLLMTRRRPRGVVGLITPWNFPLAIPAWKLAPALAHGNACVWKPSPLSPACAEALRECLEPELPADVVRLVQGGADAGVALAGHGGLGAVSFTGSAAAGAAVARQAADRGVAAQCEMGGQNASIVLADADVGRAAAIIARAAMGYAGQKCTATSRVIAERGVATDVRDALVAEIAGLVVEDPADPACEVGPLITADARAAAVAAVERGVASGARLLTGGTALDGAGHYLAPALLDVADPASELAQEEVFAPVAAVLEARDAAHAVELTNGVRYGLSTSIFTRDLDRVIDLAGRIDTGLVRVNQPTSGVDLHAPFGGEKASGLGPREQGKAARDFYTSLRTILVSPAVIE
ncbi:MAG TPA: aldehyde dehydrogenase family protein [Gaiellales bacterium]